MSKRTGPTVRGTKKDGSPRVYLGRRHKYVAPGPKYTFVSILERAPLVRVSTDIPDVFIAHADDLAMGRVDGATIGDLADAYFDRFDAANEDAHGRLPHQPGYGSPVVLVPDLPVPLLNLVAA